MRLTWGNDWTGRQKSVKVDMAAEAGKRKETNEPDY
jgi:hypothetical protein